MEPSPQVPSPEPGDAPEVLAALEVGARSWANGEIDEALRQLARAAEAAGDAGDDRRALGLARSVAELRDGLAQAPSVQAKARSMAPPPPSARAGSMVPSPRAASVPPKLPSSAPAPSAAPAKSAAPAASVAPAASAAPAANVAPAASVAPGEAESVRVSVKTSVRDPDLLVVRVLRTGQAAPPGTREAVLNLPAAKL